MLTQGCVTTRSAITGHNANGKQATLPQPNLTRAMIALLSLQAIALKKLDLL